MFNLDPYQYLKGPKFNKRRAVIKESARNGRYVALRRLAKTYFPGSSAKK